MSDPRYMYIAAGEDLDRLIEHCGLAPRTIGEDGHPTIEPLSDDALRKRLIQFLTGGMTASSAPRCRTFMEYSQCQEDYPCPHCERPVT